MKKRILSFVLAVFFIFGAAFSASADTVSDETKKELLRYVIMTAMEDSKEKFDLSDLFLDTLMEYAKESDEEYNKLLRILLESLDEYGEYYSKEEINELNADLTSVSGGIGATVEMRNGSFNIVNVLPSSASEAAGVEAGWQILEVDGTEIDGMSLYKALSYVRGDIGTDVTIKFLTNEGKEVTLTLTRRLIDIPTVSHQMLKKTKHNIGYVVINNFATTTGGELKEALEELKAQGMNRLILDLRYNGGGVLEGAIDVASCFLDKEKEILRINTNNPQDNIKYSSTGKIYDGKMLVLVNEYSASASEVVTGALKDHKRAVIMGVNTYGKGTVQTLYPLPVYGGVFKFTTAHYLTPMGGDINKIGISPDIKVVNTEYKLLDQEVEPLSLERKINIGDSGVDVWTIKEFLRMLNYDVTEGNVYDESTFNNVKMFQRTHDLYPYGVCDITTQKALRQTVLDTTFLIDRQLDEAILYMDK